MSADRLDMRHASITMVARAPGEGARRPMRIGASAGLDRRPGVPMGGSSPARIRCFHEVASAFHFALTLVASFFLLAPFRTTQALFDTDRSVETELFFQLGMLPKELKGEVRSILLKAISRSSSHYCDCSLRLWPPALVCPERSHSRIPAVRHRSHRDLRAAGVVAVFTNLVERGYWSPLRAPQFYEMVVLLAACGAYQFGSWKIGDSGFTSILLLHYGFWFWQFGSHIFFMGYGGPLAPAVGLCASLSWMFYRRSVRQRRLA